MKYATDRMIDSTDNNEYAGNERDENLIEEDLFDTEVLEDDWAARVMDRRGVADRPEYDEEGYRNDPGE